MTLKPQADRADDKPCEHSKPPHTAASLAALIEKNIEPEIAEDVLEALKRVDGQLITTRLLDHLPGGRVEWRLSKQLGWTEIKNRAYIREKREGVCLIIAKSEASVPVSAAFVEQNNPAYFRQRRARNALRARALDPANVALLERVAVLFNEVELLNEKRAMAKRQFAVFVSDGEPLSPDRVDLERACGLRED